MVDKDKLIQKLKRRLDKTTDRLGLPIDKDIKETVLYLNLFGLPTTASCQGHGHGKQKNRDRHYRGPWVEIYPKEPKRKNWFKNEELRDKVTRESIKLQNKSLELLEQFYKHHKSRYNVMLIISGIGYGFRIQSAGLEILNELRPVQIDRRAKLYKQEMKEFTNFLKRKYK